MAVSKKKTKKKTGAPKGNKNAVGNNGGAPSQYKPEYARQAYKLCLLGYTDKQLADFFDVTEQTIINWKKEHLEFFESVKEGKDAADAEVAEGLYKRAVGYRYTEKTYELGILTKEVEKELAPDPGAAMNWLSNRQKETWRNRQQVESNNTNTNLNSEPLTPEKIKEINKALEDEY